MFDRSSGKGKTQIGMGKFRPQGVFGKISTPKRGSILPKKLAESNLLPLSGPQERTNGDRKTQKKTVDS